MIISKIALPRRTFLRGVGATLALPLLDAMIPALSALAKTPAAPVPRIGFIYIPNGVMQVHWTPKGTGPDFEWSPILSPLAPLRNNVLVVSGLAHRQAESFGDGNADHHRATAAWLTGVHASTRRTGLEIRLSTTADQLAAARIGRDTRLPSIELALESPTSIACDSGADCFYSHTVSWRTPTTPLPAEIHPRVVFDRLFGDGGTAAQRQAQAKKTTSLLDSVTEDASRLRQRLGPGDRAKLTEYLDSVRSVEQRVQAGDAERAQTLALPERPTDIPATLDEHARLMFELQALAYQADITRVFTLLIGREQTNRTYPEIGVPDGHHAVSHHQHDPVLVAKKAKIDTYHVELLVGFLERLRAIEDGDGSLLDHSLILYGSGLGDGDLHSHNDLPVLVAGGGSGQLKGGRHINLPETPMANLLVSLLNKVGVPTEQLGDSTGQLSLEPLPGV
jgi:uncharacterized protein DUF1552